MGFITLFLDENKHKRFPHGKMKLSIVCNVVAR
jgi:hypothetical protein